MKKILGALFLLIPLVFSVSCNEKVSDANYPYLTEKITFEKPYAFEIEHVVTGDKYLVDNTLNEFFEKYLKDREFVETKSQFSGSSQIKIWYEEEDNIYLGTTDYGLLYIKDYGNRKFYAGVEKVNYNDFKNDIATYYERSDVTEIEFKWEM